MDEPLRCPSCNAPVGRGQVKCTDCGAPLARPSRSVRRATVAGFLLLVLFVLSVFQVGSFWTTDTAPVPTGLQVGTTTFEAFGFVRDVNGVPVAGARVEVVSRPDVNATTNATGAYRLPGVPAGVVDLKFSAENSSSVRVQAFMTRSVRIDGTLGPSGGSPSVVQHESLRSLELIVQACGAILVGASLLTLFGALACYRRRRWGLAVAGSLASLVALLPLSLLLGGLAFGIVVTSRSEFQA